ncbi:MAG: sulfurtransferase [Proteobacteria bacterium]|nr:sulfurtransferase [Pseudomonadota bacterium]
MPYETLITSDELQPNLDNPDWAVVDCRFSLKDTNQGRRLYEHSHIPGALYAHLDEDLSGPIVAGQTGRHPLPDVETFARTLSNWGIDDRVQVVAYDDMGGSIAARLWWMVRWMGHTAVAVLDGSWAGWQAGQYPVQSTATARPAREFSARPRPGMAVDGTDVLAMRQNPDYRLFDARNAGRFRGENETIDPVGGHIPGAISAPFADNLDARGYFRSSAALRSHFDRIVEGIPAEQAIFYCGSGVTAAHSVLAMTHAGLDGAKLYVGSWSEWIARPETRHLVATDE